MKNKLLLYLFILSFTSSCALAQSTTLGDLAVVRQAVLKPGELTYSIGIHCALTTPPDGASVLVMAGTAKDKNDAAMTKATFHLVNGTWQVLPITAQYIGDQLKLSLIVDDTRQPLVKEITVYMVDKNGTEISNRVYYTME